MTVHSLSEGFCRITRTGVSVPHHHVLPIKFEGTPEPGTEPMLTTRSGGSVNAEAGILGWVTSVNHLFVTSEFGLAEIYTVDAETEERQFIYAWNIGESGTGAGSDKVYQMLTMTWKTRLGNLLKLVFMECKLGSVGKTRAPYNTDDDYDIVSDYMLSDDCVIFGRDNEPAFAPISASVRYSDALLPD